MERKDGGAKDRKREKREDEKHVIDLLKLGKDQLLPSEAEGEILHRVLPRCEICKFDASGHAFFLEDGVDLVTIIMGTSFYHRARYLDYASDYLPPSPSELKKIHESLRWIEVATSPVMLSTLEDGKVVRGLSGIPSEGPVLLVGYHMLLGLEMMPIVSSFWAKRNILLRGIAHPMMYRNLRNGESPLIPDISTYDILRIMGAVPVSVTNFYKLLSSNAHVLLYPGGMREALHRKGEEYKLFWPEQSEFVRMAARFGATIIPFGSVGEDDIGQLLVDYDDLMKVPHIKAKIKEVAEAVLQSRTDDDGELDNQDPHLPLILTKLPGRFYNLFGKPIETEVDLLSWSRVLAMILVEEGENGEGNSRKDLRSRGLCLVPIECTEHIANNNGADFWSPAMGNNVSPKH
ncbi:hypothetical protein TEA_013077 [Camellia sinensis var. sinensis]|uniref:Acyltransferase n=1 Tax=Camellia sinensis var. sinensis TaxID=542762 RepID=A0A4S4D4Q7_CAMSN|nr:hypothetical protein TEA_013077 [Camellia sinensis var. sinensis]